MKTRLLLPLAALIWGCAVGYQPKALAGGSSENRTAPGVFRVEVSRWPFTGSERAVDFALLRAADMCLDAGYSYFAIDTSDISGTDSLFTYGSSAVTRSRFAPGGGYVGTTQYTPDRLLHSCQTRFRMVIKCFRSRRPGIDVFEAAVVRDTLRSQYGLCR